MIEYMEVLNSGLPYGDPGTDVLSQHVSTCLLLLQRRRDDFLYL